MMNDESVQEPWEVVEDVNEGNIMSAVVREDSGGERVYDLEERTAKFGEAVIDFCKKLPRGPLTDRVIDQLIGCGTSIGANYCEADDAVSRKEFIVKINICRKESRETKFFLRMAVRVVPELKPEARLLWLEAHALNLIFSKIFKTTKSRMS